MKKKYIHYGHNHFDPYRFEKPRNVHGYTKPQGGLWASSVDAIFGWKDWCDREDFRECSMGCSFTFMLKEDARVITILSSEGARNLPRQSGDSLLPDWVSLDFEKLMDGGWDAIELVLSSDWSLYFSMYGWDCDSILILNKDVIVEVNE